MPATAKSPQRAAGSTDTCFLISHRLHRRVEATATAWNGRGASLGRVVVGDGGWPVQRQACVNGDSKLDRRVIGAEEKMSHKSGASAQDRREPCGRGYRGRRCLHWHGGRGARAHTTIRSFPVNAKSDAFSAGNST